MTDAPRTHAVIDEYGDVVAWVATEAEAVAMLKEPYCGFKMRQPHCPFRLEDYGTPVYERSVAFLAEAIRARRNPKPPMRGDAPKVRRNAPCPCGSGRKYKRCCGGVK